MLTIWANTFMIATRQDRQKQSRWDAPDHWRQDTSKSHPGRKDND